MNLQELHLRPATMNDSIFFYELKKLVLYNYVQAIWGWDEAIQQQFHKNNFHPQQTNIIEWKYQSIGTIEIAEDTEKFFISSLYIHPNFQNKKIGTMLIQQLCNKAAVEKKRVALEVLHLNKGAQKLYERLGFTVIPNQDPIKLYMQKNFFNMSRIAAAFLKKSSNVLNVYCTAGYPRLNSTLPVMQALQNNGADLIELGMPYSDPLTDGTVIQESSSIALQNGMSIRVLFEQLKDCRKNIHVPVILMGYMNPVLQYGFEAFCQKAAEVGVDGLILPDLPEFEFETMYGAIIKKYGLDFIFLITPETSEARIRKIDTLSSGFLYAVSSSATTGNDKNFAEVEQYLQRLQQMKLNNPIMVGFGIKDRATFSAACKYSNGAIIGSAYIRALAGATDVEAITQNFLKSIIG